MNPSFIKRPWVIGSAACLLILAMAGIYSINKDNAYPTKVAEQPLPPPRHLSEEAIARIRATMQATPGLTVEVGGMQGDAEALGLAAELRSAFTGDVFKVRGLAEYTLPATVPRGVSIFSNPEMNQVLAEAVARIFTELGQSNKQWLSEDVEEVAKTGQPAPELRIIVGGRTASAL